MMSDPVFINLEYFKKDLLFALQGLNPYSQKPGVHLTCTPKENFESLPFHSVQFSRLVVSDSL